MFKKNSYQTIANSELVDSLHQILNGYQSLVKVTQTLGYVSVVCLRYSSKNAASLSESVI